MHKYISSDEFLLFQKFIEEQCGIAIGEEKAYFIESKLFKLLIDYHCASFEELYRFIYMKKDPRVIDKVIDAITVNETTWFRDKTPWNILQELLLPQFIQEIRDGKRKQVRIWSAACSTGQEPYSLTMCIDRYLQENEIKDLSLSHFEIIATDISDTALNLAKLGKYDSISMSRGLPDSYRQQYFIREGQVWYLSDSIKNAVQFQKFNLKRSFGHLGRFDMIFYRYVHIYFSKEFKTQMLFKLYNALYSKGNLFIGSSEFFVDFKEYFEIEQYKNGVFYRIKE